MSKKFNTLGLDSDSVRVLTPSAGEEVFILPASDGLDELAEYRQQLGLPSAGSEADKSTIAKLEIGGQSFFGINSSDNPNPRQITLKVNPITKTHAEADAFQQAADVGIRGGKARLIVDRDLCAACGIRGGVNSMAWQLNIEELEIITPSETKTITVKPPKAKASKF